MGHPARDPRSASSSGDQPDTVWLLEHPPVFTAGKRTAPRDRPADPGGAPVIDVDRGGMITFHGPGQLVGYPIVRLPDHVKVVDYVRRVEEALIARLRRPRRRRPRACPAAAGCGCGRTAAGPSARSPPSASGSAGASPCTASPSTATSTSAWYDRFVPCGIADAGVTSLTAELGRDVTVHDVLPERASGTSPTYWPGRRTTPTPDYEPRPAPVRQARVPVLGLPG